MPLLCPYDALGMRNGIDKNQFAMSNGLKVFISEDLKPQKQTDGSYIIEKNGFTYKIPYKGYYFDTVFMSVAGVDLDRGFMDYEEDEVRIRQALIKHARNRVVMADSSKFGKSANMCTESFDGIERLVTDRRPTPKFWDKFAQSGVEVIHG